MSENFSDRISDMVPELQTNEFYDFGGFRLDLKKHRLWRDDELIALTPKEFELLLMLVENAGRVLEKDDLHEKLWKDTFVEDGTLTRNISWLRKKLGAGNEGAEKFIETLPKRGYRFLPEVTKSSGENALVIEEQTLTRIRVEETISLSEPPATAGGSDKKWLALVFGVFGLVAIAFTAYQNYFRKSEPKTVLATHVVPFSGLPGREGYPAFSPDGKQVAFVWNGGESEIFDIYVRLIGAGEPVRLTKGERSSLYPAFSPDGKQVAFSRSSPERSEIFTVPALGGAERKITEVISGGWGFSFSPDGRVFAVPDRDAANATLGIFLVNIETGAKRRLTMPPENLSDSAPRFSPDGRQIAFLRIINPRFTDVFVVSTAGGEARQITFDSTIIKGLTWGRDGATLVFSSMRGQSSSANLWQIAAAGGEPELIVTGGKNPINPAIAPNGKTIAFVEDFEDINIWRYDITQPGQPATARKFIASARGDHSSHFSPDGRKIVFASDRTGASDVWTANADGSSLLQLTASNDAGSPRFSPDGKLIAFDLNIEGKGEIFVVNADGGGQPRRLTDNPAHDVIPAWSADGQWIYFTSNRSGEFQIWKMPAAGGEALQITKHGGLEAFAAPDGKTILYSKERGVAGLWRVSTTGGEETPIPELAEAGFWRSWTVTNKGIYFVAYSANPPYRIKFFDFGSQQTTEITATDKPPLWIFAGLSASPDGKTILYAQHDQNTSSIMLAELGK